MSKSPERSPGDHQRKKIGEYYEDLLAKNWRKIIISKYLLRSPGDLRRKEIGEKMLILKRFQIISKTKGF